MLSVQPQTYEVRIKPRSLTFHHSLAHLWPPAGVSLLHSQCKYLLLETPAVLLLPRSPCHRLSVEECYALFLGCLWMLCSTGGSESSLPLADALCVAVAS